MQISVDNYWASPTTLHLRVNVWLKEGWRAVQHDVHVPLADIEGLMTTVDRALADQSVDDRLTDPLF